MSKRRIKIVVKAPKRRMHYVLFAPDSPFKGKKTESKKAFKRKSRNQGRDPE